MDEDTPIETKGTGLYAEEKSGKEMQDWGTKETKHYRGYSNKNRAQNHKGHVQKLAVDLGKHDDLNNSGRVARGKIIETFK